MSIDQLKVKVIQLANMYKNERLKSDEMQKLL